MRRRRLSAHESPVVTLTRGHQSHAVLDIRVAPTGCVRAHKRRIHNCRIAVDANVHLLNIHRAEFHRSVSHAGDQIGFCHKLAGIVDVQVAVG